MTERLSEERLSELEVARKDARWAPQRRWWAEGDRVYINAGLGTYLLAEFSHASDAEYAVTSVNAVDDLLTEVRELRQQVAVYERELSRWQTRAEQSEFAATKNRKWAEICEQQLADLLAKREQAEAQVAVMDGRLRSLVDTADCEQCIAKSPIGCAGEACSITHIKRMVESVPNVAKILLAEREKMRAALEWYADEGHWQDGVAGWLKEEPEMAKLWGPHWRFHFCRDNGQRAREALREEVKP